MKLLSDIKITKWNGGMRIWDSDIVTIPIPIILITPIGWGTIMDGITHIITLPASRWVFPSVLALTTITGIPGTTIGIPVTDGITGGGPIRITGIRTITTTTGTIPIIIGVMEGCTYPTIITGTRRTTLPRRIKNMGAEHPESAVPVWRTTER